MDSSADGLRMEFLYGSLKSGRDIDLLLVYNDSRPYNCYQHGRFDVIETGMAEFIHGLRHHDILYTEPVFAGMLLFGSAQETFRLKSWLLHSCPQGSARYLQEKGRWLLNQTCTYIDQGKPAVIDRTIAANLMFAASYGAFARVYARTSNILTLEELECEAEYREFISPIRQVLKACERGEALPFAHEGKDLVGIAARSLNLSSHAATQARPLQPNVPH